MRGLYPRKGENLREAELRWQSIADPQMRDLIKRGKSKREVAERFGISKTAVLNALRRQAKRDGQQGQPR